MTTGRFRPAMLLLGAALSFPPAPGESPVADRSLEYLLQVAAPNRTGGPGDRPNVLFIIADDLNVALGSYLESPPAPQYATARTPNLDRLAAEGVRFDRAYAQFPLCNPSRASLLSGLRPASVEVYDGGTFPRHKIGDALRMLPEHFHDHGYFTARVGDEDPFEYRNLARDADSRAIVDRLSRRLKAGWRAALPEASTLRIGGPPHRDSGEAPTPGR